MTDAFDDAMADIAIASAANGGPTVQDVLTALRAGHDAAIETAAKLEQETKQTAKTLAQTAAVLVTAGAISDQASAVLHSLAWNPGRPVILWGVLVQCTSGWNATAAPVFSYTTTPA